MVKVYSQTSSAFVDPPEVDIRGTTTTRCTPLDIETLVSDTTNRQAAGGRRPPQDAGKRPFPTMSSKIDEPWKMPPLAKVYEALGALGDGRVQLEDERHAQVLSSDRSKTYQVEISADGRTISSNDNASYWQGYLGYPAIAVMLKRGLYKIRAEAIEALTGIPWKELNRRFRNDYNRTVEEVMHQAKERGFNCSIIVAEAEAVLSKLSEFAPLRGARRRPARPAR
jgi:hypothetical protein